MVLTRRSSKATTLYGYTVEEVARFLQYDKRAVRYWLRTGHLEGRYDERLGDWRVTATELVAFLRQTSEPMPTGVRGDFSQPDEVLAEEIVFAAEGVEPITVDLAPAATTRVSEEQPTRVRTRETVLPAC
ncbi:MAG TPA: helix-turn-helix domain-containing protein [Thermomicrobiales bacterium]|nr:helix-turn-helix domain-containing protein [Thermomicrobiales bacterium]